MKNICLKKSFICGIIVLLISSGVVSAFYGNPSVSPKPMKSGNWLYVGGSGPGNYTTIQSAITASSDGDTVFVYDDSSPYCEHIVVNKSIQLIGENRNTTVIEGGNVEGYLNWVVALKVNNITIGGFTIQFASECATATGIQLFSLQNCYIINNKITSTIPDGFGIKIRDSKNIVIMHNTITYISHALDLDGSCYNITISRNNLLDVNVGINSDCCFNSIISYNNLDTRYENWAVTLIDLINCRNFEICYNNFLTEALVFVDSQDSNFSITNKWYGNYWGRPRLLPKYFHIHVFDLIPWPQFDLFPALKPYDISSMC